MEIITYGDADKGFIKELVKPHEKTLFELMKLLKGFDEEVNNVTNDAHVEITLNLGDGKTGVYNYVYYAKANLDSVEIIASEFTDWEEQEGVERTIKLGEILF